MTHDGAVASEKVPKFHGIPAELRRVPLIGRHLGAGWISDKIAGLAEGPTPRWWKVAFGLSLCAFLVGVGAVARLISTGVGLLGVNHPVMWGWDIVNFVWWIGIAHAGTLISAILYLLRQRWRTAINRSAEAMTIFAVLCAAIYPVIHVGRPWLNYWLFPVPTSNGVWPQFKSPLIWDVFAVSTYLLVSILFWYTGLVPDFAVMRDRAKTRARKIVYGFLALGWTGSNRHWSNYEKAYLILAGLSTALVLSVHSIVSLDFSVSQLPGWHSTIFPPYFVAGAIFSGMGMVLTLVIPLRRVLKLSEIVTDRHIDLMCKVTLTAGLIVAYSYGVETLTAMLGSNPDERFAFLQNRLADPFVIAPLLGIKPAPYWWACWVMLACNVGALQLFWFKRVRANVVAVFCVAVLVNVGMWFERFVIIVTSLHRDFVPSNWGHYAPTIVDILIFAGTFGLFLSLFLLFIRYVPMIAIAEVKGVGTWNAPEESETEQGREGEGKVEKRWMLAEFDSPAQLLRAAAAIRDGGYRKWDVYTPFPVHGMDRAMGLGGSRVGWFAFCGGVIGFGTGMLMVWWMNAVNYPILIGGKPMFSPWAAFPPAFELSILFAAVGVLYGMLRFNGLPRLHNPLLKHPRFALATRDRCFIAIDMTDSAHQTESARQLLAAHGCRRIEFVEDAD